MTRVELLPVTEADMERIYIWHNYGETVKWAAGSSAATWSGNERAVRAYEKCGFVQKGRLRQNEYVDGQYYDTIMMGLLREDLFAQRVSAGPCLSVFFIWLKNFKNNS